ncbi:MAG: 4-(cytidine 5'-diphospho)-2-C-methyl-D-erythritol kinase [Pirellulales bacterium]|nr:4-(cytidine 5'-diphospho)-2-C-methyl-D-erythritol kinase [Pirellulales bacterium]
MHIRRLGLGVVVQAPAKLNLFFEVFGKRDDGYHEIETLMCPINLYDTLYVRDAPIGPARLRCRRVFGAGGPEGRGLTNVAEGADNLVVRAIELARRRSGVEQGAEALLIKRIPAAAGLGGGSSDAAAALVAVNVLWRLGRSREQLAQWAEELGSDVPFFLAGGPAVCRGRGERVTLVGGLGNMNFVLVRPPDGLATAAVYAACRAAERPRSVNELIEALINGDGKLSGRRMFNRLQPAAEKLSPGLNRLERAFKQLDLAGHGMSGSGTSYFGVCRNARHARRCAGRLRAKRWDVVFTVRSCR